MLWGTIPQVARARILANVFCVKCRDSVQITNFTGEERNGDVYLKGSCAKCGHEVMRLMEISEWDSSVTAALVYRPCYLHAWLVVRLFWNAELVAVAPHPRRKVEVGLQFDLLSSPRDAGCETARFSSFHASQSTCKPRGCLASAGPEALEYLELLLGQGRPEVGLDSYVEPVRRGDDVLQDAGSPCKYADEYPHLHRCHLLSVQYYITKMHRFADIAGASAIVDGLLTVMREALWAWNSHVH